MNRLLIGQLNKVMLLVCILAISLSLSACGLIFKEKSISVNGYTASNAFIVEASKIAKKKCINREIPAQACEQIKLEYGNLKELDDKTADALISAINLSGTDNEEDADLHYKLMEIQLQKARLNYLKLLYKHKVILPNESD